MNASDNTAMITGLGILCPIGNSPEEVLKNLRALNDGLAAATKIDTAAFKSHIAAEVKNAELEKRLTPEELDAFTDPFLRLAIAAARRALECAKIPEEELAKTAMVVATCNGGMNSQEAEYAAHIDGGAPYTFEKYAQGLPCAMARALASALKIGGAAFVINTACSGSTAAVAIAQMLVNQGRYKRVLCGGADAMALANFAGFSALKVVSEEKTAPFSVPEGMNLGEGAAFWVLEARSEASKRKCEIFGKVIGHATTGDAHHPTQPDPRGDGAFRTMRNALKNAGVGIAQIGCINAHGSGTSANDKAETKAISKILNGAGVAFVSTKSYHGHCMGAAGIIEATCQLLAMNDNFMPPTLRFTQLRQGCQAAPLGAPKNAAYDCFLSANYAFAGNNAAIVVAKENFGDFAPQKSEKKCPVISGFSAMSALGLNAAENLDALGADKIGLEKIARFESQHRAGLVRDFNPRALNRRLDFSGMNPISKFSTIAAAAALEDAGIKISRNNCEDVGLVAAIFHGADYDAHMRAVFFDESRRGDISCFSNVTANSTAGWVSKALEIKGANITFTSGANGGLQTLEYASMLVNGGEVAQAVVFAADELYKSIFDRAEKFGLLRSGGDPFAVKYFSYMQTVLGEGACAAVVEDYNSAAERGADILGEILACESATDGGNFYDADIDGDGLRRATQAALENAGVCAADIGLISWSPSATAQDSKIVNLRDALFPQVPLATTVFHTGYMPATSALHSLACILGALRAKRPIWRQHFGIEKFDDTPMPADPKYVLAVASSSTGNSHAVVIRR